MIDSEAYVRDHLLIQFMLENYAPLSFGEWGRKKREEVYKEWMAWLKYAKEAKNDKRS